MCFLCGGKTRFVGFHFLKELTIARYIRVRCIRYVYRIRTNVCTYVCFKTITNCGAIRHMELTIAWHSCRVPWGLLQQLLLITSFRHISGITSYFYSYIYVCYVLLNSTYLLTYLLTYFVPCRLLAKVNRFDMVLQHGPCYGAIRNLLTFLLFSIELSPSFTNCSFISVACVIRFSFPNFYLPTVSRVLNTPHTANICLHGLYCLDNFIGFCFYFLLIFRFCVVR